MATTFRRSSPWRARLLTLAALYFTFLGGTFITDLDFWPRVIHHLLVTAILAGWVISLWRRKSALPATPLDWPLAALLGAWLLATIFSVDPRVSAEGLWEIGVLAAFLYILVDLMRLWGARAILEPIFFSAGVVVVMAMMEFVSWYFGLSWWLPTAHQSWPAIGGLTQLIPPTIYRLQYTLSIATYLAGYLSLLMPVGLAWAVSTASSTVRRGLALWLAGAALTMLLAFSRGGLLSLGISIVVFGGLLVIALPDWRARIRVWARDWRVWAAGGLVVAAVAAIAIVWLRGDLFGHAAGDQERLDLFQSAWHIGLAHPLTGTGPSTFGREMRLYRDPTVTGDQFTTAHDVPLQFFAESGLIGLAALAWLVFATGRVAVSRWRAASGAERVRIAGVIAGLAGFGAQNLGDALITIPVLLPLLAFCAYLVMPLTPDTGRADTRVRRIVLGVVSAVIALSAAGWAISDLAQFHFARSVQVAQSGGDLAALAEIDQATRLDPAMGYYAAQRAQYLGTLASQDKTYTRQALDAYDRALHFENTYPLMRANHAVMLRADGQTDAALAEMRAAAALQPNDARYLLGVAELEDDLGRSSDALTDYQRALKLDPGSVGSGYWGQTVVRKQARDAFVKGTGTAWSAGQLAALDPACWADGAVGRSAQMSADPLCDGEIALRIRNDPAGALPWLNQAVAADKASPEPYLLRAEAERRVTSATQAEKDARTALFLGDPHAYVTLGRLAETAGNDAEAERDFKSNPPLIIQSQDWDVAVYERRGALAPLPLFDALGPNRYDFEAWLALLDLYNRQDRAGDATSLRNAILRLDPSMTF